MAGSIVQSQVLEQHQQILQQDGTNEEILSEPVALAIKLYGSQRYTPASGKRLRVLLPHYENSAAGYYRFLLPLLELRDQYLCDTIIRNELTTEKQKEDSISWADVISIGRSADQGVIDITIELRNYGIKLVVDQDDYPEAVEDTDKADLMHNWSWEVMELNQKLIMSADLLTVTTDFLKQQYGALRGRKPTVVLPNQIDALNPRWNFKKVDNGDNVVIGWMAGAVHISESDFAGEVIRRVMDQCPHVIFKAVGFLDDWMQELPRSRVQIRPEPGRPVGSYPELMDNIDIGIAPLDHNDFNRGKSDLKFLEYTMAGVLPVVQKFDPYLLLPKSICIHCDTIGEWVDTLVALANNKKKIREEYKKAMSYVLHQRTIYTHAKKWLSAYKEMYN